MARYTFKQFQTEYPNDAACLTRMMEIQYGGEVTLCAHCDKRTQFHPMTKRRAYACQECGHHIYPCAGTIFHKSRTPLTKWFLAMHLMTAAKTPFVIAVQTRDGRPIYTQMRCIAGFTKEAVKDYAAANIAPGSRVLSDGLGCFNGLDEAGLKHVVRITGGGRPEGTDFKWVNTGLGNVKSAIKGTLRSCDPQHAARYLAAFEWRYNRRFDLSKNLQRLARVAATIAPQPRKKIIEIRPHAADQSG